MKNLLYSPADPLQGISLYSFCHSSYFHNVTAVPGGNKAPMHIISNDLKLLEFVDMWS